jgi:hypothetical protein
VPEVQASRTIAQTSGKSEGVKSSVYHFANLEAYRAFRRWQSGITVVAWCSIRHPML